MTLWDRKMTFLRRDSAIDVFAWVFELGVLGVRRGRKRAFSSLEVGTVTQNFIENRNSRSVRLIYLILAMTVYFPV